MTQFNVSIDEQNVINFSFDENTLKIAGKDLANISTIDAKSLCTTTDCYNCLQVECNDVQCSNVQCNQIKCTDAQCTSVQCTQIQCNEVKCTQVRCSDCTYNYSNDCKDDNN